MKVIFEIISGWLVPLTSVLTIQNQSLEKALIIFVTKLHFRCLTGF